MEWLVWGIAMLGVAALLLAAWRFFTLRSTGTAVVWRELPGTVGDWRHGTLRYNGDDLQFYKLRSLSPSADRVFARTRATFNGHRRPQEDDLKLLEEDSIIVQVSVGGSEFEFALDSRGAMALIAWIEAAPSSRHERADHNRLLDKITRNRERR